MEKFLVYSYANKSLWLVKNMNGTCIYPSQHWKVGDTMPIMQNELTNKEVVVITVRSPSKLIQAIKGNGNMTKAVREFREQCEV